MCCLCQSRPCKFAEIGTAQSCFQAFPLRLQHTNMHLKCIYFDNCLSTVNMQHIVSVEVYSISTINLFLQNYMMSLPIACVAWNFTAGKHTTYPLKPFKPDFFFQQYTFMCILLKALLSHSIHSSGERFGGESTHGEPPLLIPLMIFIITQPSS